MCCNDDEVENKAKIWQKTDLPPTKKQSKDSAKNITSSLSSTKLLPATTRGGGGADFCNKNTTIIFKHKSGGVQNASIGKVFQS